MTIYKVSFFADTDEFFFEWLPDAIKFCRDYLDEEGVGGDWEKSYYDGAVEQLYDEGMVDNILAISEIEVR